MLQMYSDRKRIVISLFYLAPRSSIIASAVARATREPQSIVDSPVTRPNACAGYLWAQSEGMSSLHSSCWIACGRVRQMNLERLSARSSAASARRFQRQTNLMTWLISPPRVRARRRVFSRREDSAPSFASPKVRVSHLECGFAIPNATG